MAPLGTGAVLSRQFEFGVDTISVSPDPIFPIPTLATVSDITLQTRSDAGLIGGYAGNSCDDGVFLELTSNASLIQIYTGGGCAGLTPTIYDPAFSGGFNPFTERSTESSYFWREVFQDVETLGSSPEQNLSRDAHTNQLGIGPGPDEGTFARSTSGSLVAFNDVDGDVYVFHNGTREMQILLAQGVMDATRFDIIHLANDVYIYAKVVGDSANASIEVYAFEYRSKLNQVAQLNKAPIVIDQVAVQNVALATFAGGFIVFSLHDGSWTMQPYLVGVAGPVAVNEGELGFGKRRDVPALNWDSLSVKAVRVNCDLNVVLGAILHDDATGFTNLEGGTFTGLWSRN